jgi:predicted nucleic acid-binding protein
MSAESFLDTNILVYSFDSGNPQKRDCAKKLIAGGLAGNSCISFQVVQEFCNAALRKFEPVMEGSALREYQDRVLFPLCMVWPDEQLYREAVLVRTDTGYSWYDSLIVASALRAKVLALFSEDLQHGRNYRGLRIINPFLA